jgi:drug/metabolite transporter (DMT)-like permease
MKKTEIACLLSLAALWGASYLFMRIGAGEFGALAMAGARAALASLILLPLLIARRDSGLAELRRNWIGIALVDTTNAALPFLLFSYAALSINASLSAIFNAATPMYAAVIGWQHAQFRSGIGGAGAAVAADCDAVSAGLAGVIGLGCGQHGAGVCAVLSFDRACRRGAHDGGAVSGTGVRRVVGRAIPRRSVHAEDGARQCVDCRRHGWCDQVR